MPLGVRQRDKEGEAPKPTRYFSDKQEKSIVKAVGGVQTPNSGATPWIKGDVLTDKFLLEAKTKHQSQIPYQLKKIGLRRILKKRC